jgi:RNA polymerase sigma-70 factor (ECF subfamily)
MGPEEERRLVRALKRGDERAFTRLVRTYQTSVYNLVFRMMGHRREDALDVSQEVFVTVFRAIEGFRGDSKLSTWIYRIAVNHCRNRIKYLARRQRDKHATLDEGNEGRATGGDAFGSPVPRPDAQVEGLRAEAFLKRAIAALDPDQREVLVLRDVQGMTYDEIVEVTGLASGTVKSRIHRARQAIQTAWRSHKEG